MFDGKMRIGLFIGDNKSCSSIPELFNELGNELVGYSALKPFSGLSAKVKYEPYPFELLSGCDTAIVFPSNGVWAEIPKAAIRRGINLYLADLPSYSKSELNEIQHLQDEIKIFLEFGFSGVNVYESAIDPTFFNDPIYIDFERKLIKGTDFKLLKRILVFDLATIIRLKQVNIRKIKVFSLPMQTVDYNLLNVRIDLVNGSLINYTINRLGDDNSCTFNTYNESTQKKVILKSLDTEFINSDCIEKDSIHGYLNRIRSEGKMTFSIDKAIEINSLLNEVEEKISVYSS